MTTIATQPVQPEVARPEKKRVPPSQHPRRVNWVPMIAITLMHVGAVFAFFPAFFSWKAVLLTVGLQYICGLGVTVGYHRLITHRSFKTPKPIEYLFAVIGALNWQSGPIKWTAIHRLHHQHSDDEWDPHSPKHGFCWSHALWCVLYNPDFDSYKQYSQYAQDLTRDRGYVFIEKTTDFWQFLLAGLLFWWGGWSFVLWGVCVRLVYCYHATWFVNSASHLWGYRNYETTDDSRNLWWVALMSLGEGWHNNHHAYPRSARHGLKRWEFDMSWIVIRTLAFFGLATDIRLPEKGATRSLQ